MPSFTTFQGLRYDTEKVDLADVLAPPYDVIKGAMRDELMERSPFNIVRVELAAPYGEDATAEQYAACATTLNEWIEARVLARDDASFYIYEQEFAVPGSGEIKKRRGVLGALQLEEFGEGVKPHEHTLSGPKADRLNLLRATRTNISPIFGLYDGDGWVEKMLEVVCAHEPVAQARDGENVTHRLWALSDDETVNAIEAALEDEAIFIADGHHRYETALNFLKESRAAAQAAGYDWTGDEDENKVLMMCVSTSDPGLVVLPTHRLLKNVPAENVAGLPKKLAAYFEVEKLGGEGDASTRAAALTAGLDEKSALPILGMVTQSGDYVLKLKGENAHAGAMDSERSDAYNALDVTVLHRLILENELGVDAEKLAAGKHVSYTIGAIDGIEKVESGEYVAAFLLRSTPVEQVQSVAAAGDKMPQKSTYFYPKLITGLVLRPMK